MSKPKQFITIIIADNHKIFREELNTILKKDPEISLVGQALNGEELIKLTRKLKPDVIISDINLPILDGISAAKHIKKEFPDIGIIAAL